MENCNVCYVQDIISGNQHRLPIQQIDNKLITDIVIKNNINQFQVSFISGLYKSNITRSKKKKSMGTGFTGSTISSIRKVLFQGNTYVFCLVTQYKKIKTMMYELIGTVIYGLMKKKNV